MTYVRDCPLCTKFPERCQVARKAIADSAKQRAAFERSEGQAWGTVSLGWALIGLICGVAGTTLGHVLWAWLSS